MMDIFVVNESSHLVETDANGPELNIWRIAWSIDYQLRFHFGRSGWRSDVRALYLPGGKNALIPRNGIVMAFLDTVDVSGALGFHDEDGNEIPYSQVAVETTLQAGDTPCEVGSHEALELAVDPNVNLSAMTGDGSKLFALEVGDPVQGTGYDVGAPEGRTTGLTVANFALPAYFDPNTKAEKVDFRGALSAPFTVAPQGYVSFIDMRNPSAGWQQQFGSERTAPPPPDADDRLRQRGVLRQIH